MTPENLLTEWARLLVESLADAGIAHVIVSPGSRSTPLVCALLECTRIHVDSVVDERCAGFLALGRARVTGFPAAVVCTSGSAAANYFPAIVEAAMSRTPLVVVTADRPFELQDASAPQTIDQTKIYGGYVRRFVELGMPEAAESALAAVRRRAAQCVFDSVYPEPGPVHINVRARKPLEPESALTKEAEALTARVDALSKTPISRASASRAIADEALLLRVAEAVLSSASGVVLCGPASCASAGVGDAVGRFARASGYPVYAEATSQLRFAGTDGLPSELVLDGLDLLLRSKTFRETFRPDVVIQVGEPPTSGACAELLREHTRVTRHVLAPWGWPDPDGTARSIVVADVRNALERVAELLEARGAKVRQNGEWARANEAGWRVVDRTLKSEERLSEGSAVRTLASLMPNSSLLAIGNSLPVRHVDAFCRARPGANLVVSSQRGASGIDGVISGAAGAALASRKPTALVVGDVSALHDLNGFGVAKMVDVPFVIVVLNNDGGRIFEQLPLVRAGLDPERLRYWTTPHGSKFDVVAKLFRLEYALVATVSDLETALHTGFARTGCTLIEVTVSAHGAREHYELITAGIEAALRP